MENTYDGFKIAEEDLSLRGPGEFFGTKQSGLPEFKITNLVRDHRIIEIAREAAFNIIQKDPGLQRKDHQIIRKHFFELYKEKLALGDIA